MPFNSQPPMNTVPQSPSRPVVVEQKTVDPEKLREIVQQEMSKWPKPKDGNDGGIGPEGPQGPPGEGITTEKAVAILAEIYKKNPPRPGVDGSDGTDGRAPTPEEIAAAVSTWAEANRESLRGDPGESVSREEVASMVREMFDANKTQLVTLPDREEIDRWNQAWIESNGATLVQRLLENPTFKAGVIQMLSESQSSGGVTMTSFDGKFDEQDKKLQEIRELVAKLPRSVQPMYADKDGKLKPFRDPLKPDANGVVRLPPSDVDVIGKDGKKAGSVHVVIGGRDSLDIFKEQQKVAGK